MNWFRKSFRQKKRPHRETHGRSLIPFGLMTSSHEQKGRCFFCPSVTLFFRVLFFYQFGRPWVQNIGFVDTLNRLFYFFKFQLETGEFEEKVKKEVFWMGKNRQTWLFCVTPTGLPDDFSGFYYFFPHWRHVSDVPFFTDELCRS